MSPDTKKEPSIDKHNWVQHVQKSVYQLNIEKQSQTAFRDFSLN